MTKREPAISEVMVERAKAAVRDEYGSQLCHWAGVARVCRTERGYACMCEGIARAALTAALSGQVVVPRPLDEWHEDMGDVLWWKFPVTEAPWCGTPNDLGRDLSVSLVIIEHDFKKEKQRGIVGARVGGWPGYHTHFTPIPAPPAPPPSSPPEPAEDYGPDPLGLRASRSGDVES